MTIDPFAEQEKLPSVSFKDVPVGTWYEGDVVEAPALAQSRDYDTSEPLFWQPNKKQGTTPTDQKVMSIVTILEINGERRGLWASKWNKPGSMFSAIQEAQKAAGAQISVGGRLAVGIVGIEPSDNPKFNDRKLYAARYTPPNPFAEQGSGGAAPVAQQHINPHTGEVTGQGPMPDWAQPAPQQQPTYAAQPAQQAAYAQTAPQTAPASARPQATPAVIQSLLAADPSGQSARAVFPDLTPEALTALANVGK